MPKQIVFIQGAGEGAHEMDAELAEGFRHVLKAEYEVIYPAMLQEDDVHYDTWKRQIEQELDKQQGPVIFVGHSIGASILLKSLGEIRVKNQVAGIFLMAAPFWGGDGWRYDGYHALELSKDILANLPRTVPVVLYHCRDDGIVPFEHLALYKKLLPHAIIRPVGHGGHQLNNDVTLIIQDIKNLGLLQRRQKHETKRPQKPESNNLIADRVNLDPLLPIFVSSNEFGC